MKKRILALAVILVMLISLLPITAFAADPMPKVVMWQDGARAIEQGIFGNALYATFADVVDAETGEPVKDAEGNTYTKIKLVGADEEKPTTNFVKYYWNSSRNVLEITMNNVNYRPSGTGGSFMTLTENKDHTAVYDIEITLIGDNVLHGGTNVSFNFKNISV